VVSHSTTIRQLSEGAAQAVCSCGWRSQVFGAEKTPARWTDGLRHAGNSVPGSPVVVRYADDLVALCVSAEQAQQVKDRLTQWLSPRGLAFNEDKTSIVRLEDGFDFLEFSIRRYRNGKLLTKPSKAAVQRIRSRLAAEVRALHGANAEAVINALNPVIRGWAAYCCTQTKSPRTPANGSSGSPDCARRSAAPPSPHRAGRQTRTHAASCTPAAPDAQPRKRVATPAALPPEPSGLA
jgi:hypothetical protein